LSYDAAKETDQSPNRGFRVELGGSLEFYHSEPGAFLFAREDLFESYDRPIAFHAELKS